MPRDKDSGGVGNPALFVFLAPGSGPKTGGTNRPAGNMI